MTDSPRTEAGLDGAGLLPCPRCGCDVEFEHSYHEDDHRYPREFWHVRIDCCLRTDWHKYGNQEQYVFNVHSRQAAEQELAAWWNTRAPQSSPAAVEVERLRAALIQCRDQFRFYAREHIIALKYEKAETNNRFVDLANAALSLPAAVDEGWRTMESAPKDGTLLRLLVNYEDDDAVHPIDDATETSTIGFNNDDNVGEGEGCGWKFAGWCWSHDHFTEGAGKVVGWLPYEAALPAPPLSTPGSGEAK